MSGILDKKSRVIDAILTVEGRRQMAEGTFDVSYVTFTDASVAYIPDPDQGHVDPTDKIYFEACNLPQDQITFEANDEGKLVPFRRQDIHLETPGKNVPSSYAQGSLVNGKLSVMQYHHGRRVKASLIEEDALDKDKGFTYSDVTGLTGSVLIYPSWTAGKTEVKSTDPFVAYVGTRGGLGPQEFALALSGAIASLSHVGGPSVFVEAINDSLYFDNSTTLKSLKIFATGTLSSPLVIEETAIGGNLLVDEVENASFASQIQGLLTSSFDNFKDLQTIASINRLFEDQGFELSTNELTFDMSKIGTMTLKALTDYPPSLNSIESMFSDSKFSHLDNFLYLPPIVKTSDSLIPDKTKIENLEPYLLGDYPSWGDNLGKMSFGDIMSHLSNYQSQTPVYFNQTSLANNVIGQFFEVSDGVVSKLDVVDFGDVMNDAQEMTSITNKVFFVGKTFLDNRGTTCFVNVFTLVFSKDPRKANEGVIK
jgi:hypothetical protein